MLENTEWAPTLHRCLGDRHRRLVLLELKRADRPRSLTELAARVYEESEPADEGGAGSEESEVAGDEEGAGSIDRLRLELYHVHLPRLEDAGLVDWDREENRVRLSKNSDAMLETEEATVQ